jgi:hypothetical protein
MSDCQEEASKKYRVRPSVPRKANHPACRGKRFLGNDGRWYNSKSNSLGIFRWVVDPDQTPNDATKATKATSSIPRDRRASSNIPKDAKVVTPKAESFSLASLYDATGSHGFMNELPCPRMYKDQIDNLSQNEMEGLWNLLNDIYCTAIGQEYSIGPMSSDISTAKKIAKFLTGMRAQKAWNEKRIVDIVGSIH